MKPQTQEDQDEYNIRMLCLKENLSWSKALILYKKQSQLQSKLEQWK